MLAECTCGHAEWEHANLFPGTGTCLHRACPCPRFLWTHQADCDAANAD